MDVELTYKFKGSSTTHDITPYVISYSRNQKICSGVGVLEVMVQPAFFESKDPKPWDLVKLYEGGHKKGEFYVGEWSPQQPDGSIVIFCQDNSKRLQDYFIAETYLINYASYTRYWIEKFLAEAGASYNFTTESYGSLMSNNTSVGLQTAYDQIMNLLQISGWYLYFDANGDATIGELNKDVNTISLSVNSYDILTISVNKNDKMLRNRAVVWGNGDPTTGDWVFADISTTTKWNYDANDLRTMVVSNSNIPNSYSAYGIAEELLTEFARLTVEKRVELTGARNIELGEFVKVKSPIYKGIGLVTSLDSEMSATGLITRVTLDERCPRLFAFYNFGDYVYVGTEGSGVWRKHIEDDSTWYDYSFGLNELYITDLNKNNDLLTTVTRSGEANLSFASENLWTPIVVGELIASGIDGLTTIVNSGIMSRAVAQNRTTNDIKLVVDTDLRPNLSYYDAATSHMWFSSLVNNDMMNSFAWLLDINEAGGVDAQYQITMSGNPSFSALDVENDGNFDYVSVVTSGVGEVPFTDENDFGSAPFNTASYFVVPFNDSQGLTPKKEHLVQAFDDYIFDPDTEIAVGSLLKTTAAQFVYEGSDYKEFWDFRTDTSTGTSYVTRRRLDSYGTDFIYDSMDLIITYYTRIFSIKRIDASTCRVYYLDVSYNVCYVDVDVDAQTVSSETSFGAVTDSTRVVNFNSITYFLSLEEFYNTAYHGDTREYNFKIYVYHFNKETDTLGGGLVFDAEGTNGNIGRKDIAEGSFKMYPKGEEQVQLSFMYTQITGMTDNYPSPSIYDVDFHYVHGPIGDLSDDFVTSIVDPYDYTFGFYPDDSFGSIQPDVDALSESSYCRFIAWGNTWSSPEEIVYFRCNKYGCEYQNTPFGPYQPVSDGSILNPGDEYYIKELMPVFGVGEDYGIIRTWNGGVEMYRYIEPNYFTDLGPVEIEDWKTIRVFPQADSYDGSLFIEAQDTSVYPYVWHLVGIDRYGNVIKHIDESQSFAEFNLGQPWSRNGGSFFWYHNIVTSNFETLVYYGHSLPPLKQPIYYVMVRNENEFIPIISGYLPFRLDASSFPMLVAQTNASSLQYIYSYPDLVEVTPAGVAFDDYSRIIGDMKTYSIDVNGVYNKYAIISNESDLLNGVISTNIDFNSFYVYSGGFLSAVETSNYKLPGQYVFTATSGVMPVFLQKNPDVNEFTNYSYGLPDKNITVIRLDDMI